MAPRPGVIPWWALALAAGLVSGQAWAEGAAAGAAGTSALLDQAETLLLTQRARPDLDGFLRARDLVERANQGAPRDSRAWTGLAWTRMIEHRFLEAYEAARTADGLAGAEARNLALMCDALTELGRYEEAVAATQRLMDLRPGVPAWIRAARQRFLHSDLEGAITLLGRATHVDHTRGEATAWVWLELARMHMQAGDLRAMEAAITAARGAYPDLAAIPHLEGQLHQAQGNSSKALDLYLATLARQPSAEVALDAWRLATRMGQSGVAKHQAALLEGLARLPGANQSRRALAEYFADSGQTGKALEWAREEMDARPDIYSHATLARALAGAGDWPRAKGHATLALALNTPDRALQSAMDAILKGTYPHLPP